MTLAAPERTTRLNQIIAVRTGVKGDVNQALTKIYHLLQKGGGLLSGQTRTYKPHNDEDFVYPPESSNVQVKADLLLTQVADELTRLFDIQAQLDWTNQEAHADIVLLGGDNPVTLVPNVPVSYLLFLDKQLTNLEAVLRRLPVLDATEDWTYDPNQATYRTRPVGSVKTKKVYRNHVKAEATDRHPAQVDTYTEDIPIGTWSTVKFSGALPADRIIRLVGRVNTLQQAVKFAREQANMVSVVQANPGRLILEYVFAPE